MKNYPLVRAWCAMSGSFDYYTSEQIRLAEQDRAPQDAIYRDVTTGNWRRFQDIKYDETKLMVARYADVFGVDAKRLVAEGVLVSKG